MTGMRDNEHHATPEQYQAMDLSAWNAICAWPEHAGFEPVFEGLDYSELTRWFLWDKVGRSFRARIESNYEFEENLYKPESLKFLHENFFVRPRLDRFIKPYLAFRTSCKKLRIRARNRIYVPFPNRNLDPVIKQLVADRIHTVLLPGEFVERYPGAHAVPDGIPSRKPNFRMAAKVTDAIESGLLKQQVRLIEKDREILKNQVRNLFIYIEYVKTMMTRIRPEAVLVHVDNHPPYQPFVLEANRRGILSLCVQHGLDCENFYLDQPYARAIALWGTERRDRYLKVPGAARHHFEVTGNPVFDDIQLEETSGEEGSYILWLTRPHVPEKCLSPSRKPQEGLEILKALHEILSQKENSQPLYVRPHPADYAELYAHFIKTHGLQDRIRLAGGPLNEVIAGARIVVCEDSSAGLDALIGAKPLILAHFSKSMPSIPFVESGVAKPAWDKASLANSLSEFDDASARALARESTKRLRFIEAHAGSLDHGATHRVCRFFYDRLRDASCAA